MQRETRRNHIVGSVTTFAVIMRPDPQRSGFTLVNIGSTSLRLLPGDAPSGTDAVLLDADGGTVIVDGNTDGELASAVWYAEQPAGLTATFQLWEHRKIN